jgi:hypothetical protein
LIACSPAFLFLGVGQRHGDLVDYITAHGWHRSYNWVKSECRPEGDFFDGRPARSPHKGKLGQRKRVSGARPGSGLENARTAVSVATRG